MREENKAGKERERVEGREGSGEARGVREESKEEGKERERVGEKEKEDLIGSEGGKDKIDS